MRPSKGMSQHRDDGLRLSQVIREERQRNGWSRDWLARRADISRDTLTKIERGDTVDPGVFTVDAIATGLNTDVVSLVTQARQMPLPATPLSMIGGTGLLSIGYEGRSIVSILEDLTQRGVGLVADVRLNPISRKSGLSKTRLAAVLHDAGIDYRHYPALGNPKNNRGGFADPTDHRPRQHFRALLEQPLAQAALVELTAAGREQLVAVLCMEHDDRTCHRDLVIEAVVSRDPRVVRYQA